MESFATSERGDSPASPSVINLSDAMRGEAHSTSNDHLSMNESVMSIASGDPSKDILSSLLLLSQQVKSSINDEENDDIISVKDELNENDPDDDGVEEDMASVPSVNISAGNASSSVDSSPANKNLSTSTRDVDRNSSSSTVEAPVVGTTQQPASSTPQQQSTFRSGGIPMNSTDDKNTPKLSHKKSFSTSLPSTSVGLGSSTLGINNSSGNDKVLSSLSSSTGNISIDDLRRYFHLPIAEVARQFGTCTTALKKICRKLNISKWPYRQILSLTKSIQSLEMASLNDNLEEELKNQYKEQILVLQKAIGEVLKNPNKPIDALNLSSISFENSPNHTTSHITTIGGDLDGDDDDNDQPMSGVPTGEVDMDVQHIIKAAAQNIAQPDRITLLPLSASGKKGKGKRKLDGAYDANDIEPANGESSNGHRSSHLQQLQIDNITKKLKLPVPPSIHSFTALSMDFSTADFDNGAYGPLLEVGSTKVQHNPRYENQKYQFSGPVQLAPLVRKKMRPNANRRVVPLMEPDIGSNYSIEFIPQLIVSMLHKSLDDPVPDGQTGLNASHSQ